MKGKNWELNHAVIEAKLTSQPHQVNMLLLYHAVKSTGLGIAFLYLQQSMPMNVNSFITFL